MTLSEATQQNYSAWQFAYDYFGRGLFSGGLPGCLITMQRRRAMYGFFFGARFKSYDGKMRPDEIALNPSYLSHSEPRDGLATLVHEMVHQWQHHYGKPSRGGYHNMQWARKMIDVGLVPSDTGQQGGKLVGQRVNHFIRENGPFDRLCDQLLKDGFVIPYVEVNFAEENEAALIAEELETRNSAQLRKQRAEELRKKKAASKSRYTCPGCDLPKHVWGKPGLHVICGECGERFVADATDDGAGEDWSLWRDSPHHQESVSTRDGDARPATGTSEAQPEIHPQISLLQGCSDATEKASKA
jgi:transcription elongation factor Elf1